MFAKYFTWFVCIVLWVSSVHSFERKNTQVPFKVRLNDQGQFIDNFGRVRMFRGLNSVMKGFPWYDNHVLNETRLKFYKEWGFNIVRLGSMWTGMQPTETEYNVTYIGILVGIVRKLNGYGLYSLLDMHQDVLSSKFNGYDGIPLWLMEKFPKIPDYLSFPFPLKKNETYFWPFYYFTYAASEAFQNLYTSDVGLKYWENIWSKIASIFSNETSVIGYELINEPWFGNFYTDPRRIMPGYAGKHNLLPAYERLVKAIRHIDNETLVFYEPVTIGSYLPTVGDLGTGFDRVPGGSSQRLKSVLSYHYYCFAISSLDPTKEYPVWGRVICDDIFAKQSFKSVQSDIVITGGGSMLTEFGQCSPDGNSESINTMECNAVVQLADQHFQSYTYWDSEFFDDQGHINESVVATFARSYPRAIQGQPIEYTFNKDSGTMKLVYTLDLDIVAPTELFLPISVHYKSGFNNQTNPTMETSFDAGNSLFYVIASPNSKPGMKVTVLITSIKKT